MASVLDIASSLELITKYLLELFHINTSELFMNLRNNQHSEAESLCQCIYMLQNSSKFTKVKTKFVCPVHKEVHGA